MPASPLVCRKTQLSVLTEACARRTAARIGLHRPGMPAELSDTALVRMETDGLLIVAPSGGVVCHAPPETAVDVFFQDGPSRYYFAARLCGPAEPWFWTSETEPLLRLRRPCTLELRPPRVTGRLSLPPTPPVQARLVSMFDQDVSFALRMTDISTGGFAGVLSPDAGARPTTSTPFWVNFALPADNEPLEFVVRLVHCEPAAGNDEVVTGWAFCGSDDPDTNQRNVARIERFLAQRGALPDLARPAPRS